jgi:endoglucanase
MGAGINLGNFLETPGARGTYTLKESDFSIIKQAGFATLRVPICWSAHVSGAPAYTIDPAFLKQIDWVVDQAQRNKLQAILDYHGDDALMKDPGANADRFVSTWKQIAHHFRGASTSVLFELLNEPNQKFDDAQWNALLIKALAAIRPTNPDRIVIVGSIHSNRISALPTLVLPENDRHILVTVHYYDPHSFTHQGASWIHGSAAWLGTTWQGTDAQKQDITKAFDQAAAWAQAHQRPIFLGEFGTFQKGDLDSRARWTAFVARTAESHGFPWAYWEFCSGFGAYDPQAHQWREPLLRALFPAP